MSFSPIRSISDLSHRPPKSLLHSARIPPNPQANLSGWFDRPATLWPIRRWLELRGTTLIYRHTPTSPPQWTADSRECRIAAGKSARQIIITRPSMSSIMLTAPTITDLKLWFTELKRVSDNIRDFYHLSAQISHADTSSIVLGMDKTNGDRVAVFIHDKSKIHASTRVALSKRDSRIIRASQTHESTLSLIDVFETTNTVYTVTTLVTGGTLHNVLTSLRKCTLQHVRPIATSLLNAVAHLHKHGIVHGSVDAHHVLCTAPFPSPVQLIVFGTAALQGEEDGVRSRGKRGSGRAPEVVCFHSVTHASDIFSTGALIFKLLAGQQPFIGGNDAEYLSEVSLGAVGPLWQGLGQARELLASMLAENPENRPSATQCLQHAWFDDGRLDDAPSSVRVVNSDGVADLTRVGSDPKTVIVDFETKACVQQGGSVPHDGSGQSLNEGAVQGDDVMHVRSNSPS